MAVRVRTLAVVTAAIAFVLAACQAWNRWSYCRARADYFAKLRDAAIEQALRVGGSTRRLHPQRGREAASSEVLARNRRCAAEMYGRLAKRYERAASHPRARADEPEALVPPCPPDGVPD